MTAKGPADEQFNWYLNIYDKGANVDICVLRNGQGSPELTETSTTFDINVWQYLVGTFESTSDLLDIYKNGDECSYTTHNPSADSYNSDTPMRIGSNDGWGEHWDGLIDEVRISNVERSDDWIKTTYNTIQNPNSFISIDNEEGISP